MSGSPPSDYPRAGLVRLLCGVAGSGKTTYARQLERRGFVRLSVDDLIWRHFGRYGLDYAPSEYDRLQEAAEQLLHGQLVDLMHDRVPVVVDLSLWQRATRDGYKALVAQHGCEWELVHLHADLPTLRARLAARARRFDADAAFPITPAQLDAFIAGFEAPDGEGEVILRWDVPRGPTQ